MTRLAVGSPGVNMAERVVVRVGFAKERRLVSISIFLGKVESLKGLGCGGYGVLLSVHSGGYNTSAPFAY